MTDPIHGAQVAMQSVPQLDAAPREPEVQGASFADVLGGQLKAPDRAPPVQEIAQSDPAQRLEAFVQDVFEDQGRAEEMMTRCADGEDLSQGELLRLQGLIYAYAQKIDLASKVVDKATGGLKQVMNTQV